MRAYRHVSELHPSMRFSGAKAWQGLLVASAYLNGMDRERCHGNSLAGCRTGMYHVTRGYSLSSDWRRFHHRFSGHSELERV